jgi:hypothetical protein
MKRVIEWILLGTMLLGCDKATEQNGTAPSPTPFEGTWKLVRGTMIEKGDTTVTDYTKDKSFIKIINDTHFAFLLHDLTKGKDSTAVFASGGGTYSLAGGKYTEHLEYCSDRAWEGHDFAFDITVRNDSLIQRGIEQIESAGVNRVNIEEYTKMAK